MTTPSATTPDAELPANGDGYWLFTDVVHSSLEPALDRFRALITAHNRFEPRIRTERRGGRRCYVVDVYVRTDPRTTEEP